MAARGQEVEFAREAFDVFAQPNDSIRNHFLNRYGCKTIAVDVSATALRLGRTLFERDSATRWDLEPEFLVYDGHRHESMSRYPELAERSFVVSSFGKTYHVTGWKVGYVVAPAALTAELRTVHQFVTFSTHTPVQHAIAEFLAAPVADPAATTAGARR